MAVYTEISDENLTDFIATFDLGDVLSCKGIAEGVENSNFQLMTETGTYILTLYEKRVNPADLPFFLGLIEHLSQKGIPCPTPVRAKNGQALNILSDRPAALVTFLSGMWPRRIQNHHVRALGTALADLHMAGTDFKLNRENTLGVNSWRAILESCKGHADDHIKGITAELHQELDDLEANWPRNLPTGVIHADLFPDNVFFRGEGLSGLIDFYFACNDFLAYDIAICLNAWCFERDGSFNITKAKKMLTSYGKVRKLSVAELSALPLLARGAAMRFLVTRLFDWIHTPADALVTPKDPRKYLQILRFHRGLKGPGAYGLELT